jgi:polysaccharide export outer membrane protein
MKSTASIGASLLIITLVSCSSYKQNIMFGAPENYAYETLPASPAATGFQILPNDFLSIEIFTNNGERIVDPNPELSDNPQGGSRKEFNYLVDKDGVVKLPMIGEITLKDMDLRQAEAAIQEEYQNFFKEPYVVVGFTNKRVVLLGALGGQVIPLANQNIRLTEILALGKGLESNAKANSIKVLRGNQVFNIDLSTIEGYQTGNMLMESGDVVYVEPVRRPFSEALRENSSILGLIVSLASLVVVINSIR